MTKNSVPPPRCTLPLAKVKMRVYLHSVAYRLRLLLHRFSVEQILYSATVPIKKNMHVFIYTYMYLYKYMYTYIYMYIYIYIYIHIYRHMYVPLLNGNW